jgi:hypothetical protein
MLYDWGSDFYRQRAASHSRAERAGSSSVLCYTAIQPYSERKHRHALLVCDACLPGLHFIAGVGIPVQGAAAKVYPHTLCI